MYVISLHSQQAMLFLLIDQKSIQLKTRILELKHKKAIHDQMHNAGPL
jgi:hypothetical protein